MIKEDNLSIDDVTDDVTVLTFKVINVQYRSQILDW